MNRTCSFSTNRGQFEFNVHEFCNGMIETNFCTVKIAQQVFKLLEYKQVETLVIDKLSHKVFVRLLTKKGRAYDYWVTARGSRMLEPEEY